MPKGQKTIDWTDANDARLLLTIIAVGNIRPDYAEVAAAFGMNVNATAIQSRLTKLRQKAKSLSINSGRTTALPKSTTKKAPVARAGNAKNSKAAGVYASQDLSDDESVDLKDEDQEMTPPDTDSADNDPTTPKFLQKTISGRVTKARVSPRKSAKKDYKVLDNPFAAMNGTIDGDGEKVFDTEKSDSEGTIASDGDYMKGAMEATIKMEEAI